MALRIMSHIEIIIPPERIHREISHAERRQVLEKMRALARLDTVIVKSSFHNKDVETLAGYGGVESRIFLNFVENAGFARMSP